MTFPFLFVEPHRGYQPLPFNPAILMLSTPPSIVKQDGTQEWELPPFEPTEAPQEPIYIAGYASVVIKDQEQPLQHLVTTEALQKALDRFMAKGKEEYRNVNLRHSNIQVAKVIEEYTAKEDGRVYKTRVDENGLFLVCELRADIDAARVAIKEIQDGLLNSFSISGEALDAKIVKEPNEEPFLRIDDLELWEITLAEEGKNPAAKFVLVKQLDTDHVEYAIITPSDKDVAPGGYLMIEDFLPFWQKPIRIFREFVCLVGGMAQFGATKDDVDLLFRVPFNGLDWTPFEFRLARAVEGEQRDRISFLYGDQGGPFTSYIPLYDLVLMPSTVDGKHILLELAKKQAQEGRSTKAIRARTKRSKSLRDVRNQLQLALAASFGQMALDFADMVEQAPRSRGLKNDLRKVARNGMSYAEGSLVDGYALSMGLGAKIAGDYLKLGDKTRITKQDEGEEVDGLPVDDERVQDLADAAGQEISETVVKMVWHMIKARKSEDLSWAETAKAVKDRMTALVSPEDPLKFVKGCGHQHSFEGLLLKQRPRPSPGHPLGPRSVQYTEEEIAERAETLAGFTEGQLANRIATIINTVTSDGLNFGMLKEYDNNDVVTVEVLDNEYPTSCKACQETNGSIWTIGYALRRENRLEHPNCVRQFIPIGIGAG